MLSLVSCMSFLQFMYIIMYITIVEEKTGSQPQLSVYIVHPAFCCELRIAISLIRDQSVEREALSCLFINSKRPHQVFTNLYLVFTKF